MINLYQNNIRTIIFVLAAPLLVLIFSIFAISGESFWIDELTTAWLAGQSSFGDLLTALKSTGSEVQMPFFVLYTWLWGHIFGVTEFSLRYSNIIWAVLGIWAMQRLLKELKCKPYAILFLVFPLLLFQMNEARPYVMTFALAAWSITALNSIMQAFRDERQIKLSDSFIFFISIIGCLATSLLNIFILPALGVYALWFMVGRGSLKCFVSFIKINAGLLIILSISIATLLVYYAWTMANGYGGQKQPYTLTNLGFAIYEWLGFGGLGAPRNELREVGLLFSIGKYGWTLLLGVMGWMLMGIALLINIKRIILDVVVWRLLSAFVCGGLILILIAVLAPASIWGRHFIFLLPFFVAVLARGFAPIEQKRVGGLILIASGALIAVLLISAGRQRYLDSYKKDPFREAVAEINGNNIVGQDLPVIWVAYDKALDVYKREHIKYYDFSVYEEQDHSSLVICGADWSPKKINQWHQIHRDFFLVTHRLDKTDRYGGWKDFISQSEMECVWLKGNIKIYHVFSQ